METIGLPELIILISIVVTFVVIPIIVLAVARGLIRYGREQARREFESKVGASEPYAARDSDRAGDVDR